MQKSLKDVLGLWDILKPFHKHFYIQLCIIFLSQFFIIAVAYVNSNLLNSLVEKQATGVFMFLGIWSIVLCADLITNHLGAMNREKHLTQTLFQYLQEFSLRNILNLTVSQHVEDHSALKMTVIQRGEEATRNMVDKIITVIVPAVTLVILTLGTLFFYNDSVALFCLAAIAIIFTYSYYFSKKRYPLITKNRDNWNENNKIRIEAFAHLQLVKTLHREESFIKKYLLNRLEIVKYHMQVHFGTIRIGTVRFTLTEFSSIITLGLASYYFFQGAYPIGTVYLIFSLTNRVYWQISWLSQTMREIPILYADTEKYIHIMDMKPSFNEHGKTKVDLGRDIIISNLSFAYPKGDKKVFDDVSFTIPSGKRVAFVGASGSGKSTIIKLLLRAYDYSDGSIKVGNTELRDIDAGYLREHIGYVEQHVDLLDDTIKENILLGVRERERSGAEKRLEEIAHKARIDQFYHRLGEKKFDTLVGERGVKLSGGERQRVGIARAIIKNPEILIFDEATSSLDSENEAKVMEAINDVSEGKTTIIIAHRLSTVREADKIIVMDKGKIVAEGTHSELMSSSLGYQNLVAHQLS